jgi:hypothetical protein
MNPETAEAVDINGFQRLLRNGPKKKGFLFIKYLVNTTKT